MGLFSDSDWHGPYYTLGTLQVSGAAALLCWLDTCSVEYSVSTDRRPQCTLRLVCCLQPKWSRDGRYIAYDSSAIWSTGMQVRERVGFKQAIRGTNAVYVMV